MASKTATFKPDMVEKIHESFKDMGAFNNIINETMKDEINKKELSKRIASHLHYGGVTSKGLIVEDEHLNGKPCRISLRDKRFWCSECTPKFCMHITYALLHIKIGELHDLDKPKKK